MASRAALCLAAAAIAAGPATARSPDTDAMGGIEAFVSNCFSPRLTAERAGDAFSLANIAYDFYDLDPLTAAAPSPVTGQRATPGTDRRCEVSFAGDYAAEAARAVIERLAREGLTRSATVPPEHEALRMPGTALLAARRLNPQKIAVVHIGTRPGARGIETFLNVERRRSPQ